MKYRADIDGLRAIAVIPVVLFHLGASLSGGYTGVDVFFVISGFLITTILADDIDAGRYSLRRFYERRIRRIVPAYVAMVAVTSIVAYAVLLPEDLEDMAASAAASALFSSNVFFWLTSGDYFAAPAELKPLLHTWSLSVEEQFYVFFPPLLWLTWRTGLWKWRFVICLVALIFSLALSVYGARYASLASFYLLPTRAWELLAGSLLALRVVPSPTRTLVSNVEGLLGLALMGASFFLFNSETEFPGYNAILPVLGAVLVIHAGMGTSAGVAARLLSLPAFRFTGQISYSLYLWHWPIIVISKYYLVSALPFQELATLVLCYVVAILSWRYIEQPFRAVRSSRGAAKPFLVAAVALVAIGVTGVIGIVGNGLPYRVPQEVLEVANKLHYFGPDRECGNAYKDRRTIDTLCLLGDTNEAPSFALLGDSHANALAPAVFEAARLERRAGIQVTDTGYRPLLGFLKFGEADKYRYLHRLSSAVLDTNIRHVVVPLYWRQAVDIDEYLDEEGQVIDGFDAVLQGLTDLAERNPQKQFLIVASPANSTLFGAGPYARAMWFEREFRPFVPKAEFQEVRSRYLPILDQLARMANVELLDLSETLCNSDCAGLINGRPAYSDDNHLSYEASRLFVGQLRAFLAP